MNERIKQLVKQAEQYAIDKANEGTDEDFDYSFDDDFQAKFAELIVKECMTVARGADGLDATHEAWYLIEQHFGVKE